MALKAVSPAADIHQSVRPISNTLPRSPSSTPTAAATRHYAATNMSRQQQRPPSVQYDFLTALGRLQDKIQALSAAKQQAGAAPTRLGELTLRPQQPGRPALLSPFAPCALVLTWF